MEPSLDGLGVDLLYHWEVPASGSPLITLDGSTNASQLNDRVGSAHCVQATAANRPAHHATGGPNNKPYLELQSTGRVMIATISVADANRAGLYVVGSFPGSGATRNLARASGSAGGTLVLQETAGPVFRAVGVFTGSSEAINVTVPAHDTAFHLFAIRPLATGWLNQIDGSTTTPDFVTSATVRDLTSFSIGTSTSGGNFCFAVLVNNPDAAKDTIVKEYVAAVYGLTLS